MKKFFVVTVSLLLLGFLTFLFAQFTTTEEEGVWHLEKIEEFKIMSVKQDGTPFSEALSALFLKKIRYESLPVSSVFFFTNSSSLGNPKEITCRIVYKDIEIEQTIKELDISPGKSLFRSSGTLSFNLSDLKKTRTEQEILEFMNAFPLDPQIKYSIKPVYDSDRSDVQQDWINLY